MLNSVGGLFIHQISVALWINKTWSLRNIIAELILFALQNEPEYICWITKTK